MIQVRLMLVLAPAACIMSGIAISEIFHVLTRSIKFEKVKPSWNPSPVSVLSFFVYIL